MAENKSFYRRTVEYLQKPPQRLADGVKRNPLDRYDSIQGSNWGFNTQSGYFPSKLIDEMGDGLGNSAVVACINVLATSFAEPSIKVYKKIDGGREIVDNHPMEILMKRPNEFSSGSVLAHYLVTSLSAHGDAFLLKVKNNKGQVVQLVPLMPNYVKVRGNEKELITHYEYHAVKQKNGLNPEYLELPRENVVHIRQGMDPDDHRRGFSPLRSVMRELAGDEAAGQFAVALLHNMAVPGVILSPKDDTMGGPSREEADAIAQAFKSKFSGANRGAPMIMTGAMDVDVVSFTPEQLNLTALRRLPEERVSSVLGVPAILAGLGAGLDAATYNNTRELREFFTEQKMIPLWSAVAAELTHQLLHKDFEENDYQYEAAYDLEQVRALASDKKDQVLTMNSGVQGGFVTIAEARKALGLEADESHEIFLRPLNMVAVPEGETGIVTSLEEPAAPAQPSESEESEEDVVEDEQENGKGTLDTGSYKPQTRRTRRIVRRKKQVSIDLTMEFKSAEGPFNYGEKAPAISAKVKEVLQKKVKDHNDSNPKYRTSYGTLATVFRRGVGAYRTNPASVRGNVSSATQWGIARVNAFLKGLKGSFPRKPFDQDLLPAGHPNSSKSRKAASVSVGDTVSWSINKDPDPPSTVHGVVVSVNSDKKEATMNVWAIMENGDHKKTDRNVTMPFGKLKKIADWRKGEKAPKDITNFPSSGDNQKISLSNSNFKQFPDHAYVKNLKENYPGIWRRAGTGGNPPTSFTGNDAYRNWTKYKAGDRSASVLSWVKRRERFMSRHSGNTRLNGIIAVMKWGGVTKSGVSAMKKIVNEQKKKEDARRKAADNLISNNDDLTS
jgi:HK97 family phage portal protein